MSNDTAPMIWIDAGALREPQEVTGTVIAVRLFGRTSTMLHVCEDGRTPLYIAPTWVRAEPQPEAEPQEALPVPAKKTRVKKS